MISTLLTVLRTKQLGQQVDMLCEGEEEVLAFAALVPPRIFVLWDNL